MSAALETARQAWGNDLPDWVEALANACAFESQAKAAGRINRSPSVVSQVLRRKYPGDMAGVEDAVRGAWMGAQVTCPALGSIATDVCQKWRTKARTFSNTNAQRVQMFKACQRCPRHQKETE